LQKELKIKGIKYFLNWISSLKKRIRSAQIKAAIAYFQEPTFLA
jgi:putative component of toxin-antitoxin plasmid stabilization module